MDILLRKGVKEDLPQVLALIKELAEYENALDQVKVTLDQLEKDGIEDHPYYYLLVAEHENQIIGVCFYFIRYSTWKGKVLFLEDFVVKEEYRRKGIANHLYSSIEEIANELGFPLCCEVNTFPENKPSLEFHKKFGFVSIGKNDFMENSVVYFKKSAIL